MRFIHTADVHLDSPLVGLSAYEGAPTETLRGATRAAFVNLIDHAIDEQVQILVIAGDLYDGDWRDFNTGIFFAQQMGRLKRANIPAYVLFGNHDAASEITKRLQLPDNVIPFSHLKPETHLIESLKVALHGQSFRRRDTTDNLAKEYPSAVPGYFNIGVLHTALEGHAQHARYAPCTLDELKGLRYDYWALGHVHEFAVHCEAPWIVYPGNLQGRHIREQGARGAVLVTVDEGRTSVERFFVDVLRWQHLDVPIDGASSFDDVVNLVGQRLADAVQNERDGKPLAVRLQLTGRTPAHGELFGREHELRAHVLAQAVALGTDAIWVEKVVMVTQPPADVEHTQAREDALADLQTLMGKAADDPQFVADLKQDLADILGKAPRGVADEIAPLRAIKEGRIAEVVQSVSPGLIARLSRPGT
ncbi:MAG: metallophosphoesterase family protein [Nevskiales bacterium]